MTQCQYCGTPVPSAFCPQCGAPVQPHAAQPLPRKSPLQLGLGIAATILGVLTSGAAGYLYWQSLVLEAIANALDTYPADAVKYYDLTWAVLVSGGGLALLLSGWAIFIKSRRRGWAIAGAILALVNVVLGGVLMA